MCKNITKEEQKRLDEQLFDAIIRNDLIAVKAAVKAGADINTQDKYNECPLHISSRLNAEITKYLLEAGADPNVQDCNGSTPLHSAVSIMGVPNYTSAGSAKQIELFLQYNADMYIKDNSGCTPYRFCIEEYMFCIEESIPFTAELFLSYGYIPSKEELQIKPNSDLFKAVNANNLCAVKKAVEEGADVNAVKNKESVLYSSIFSGCDIKITEYLLENGADPNVQDNTGWTPLHVAASVGLFNKSKVLVDHKADMYLYDYQGRSPFFIAIQNDRDNIAEFFVLNGYVPFENDFAIIENIEKREIIKTRFMTLASQVQEHKKRLTEETKAMEFAYADEIIEM